MAAIIASSVAMDMPAWRTERSKVELYPLRVFRVCVNPLTPFRAAAMGTSADFQHSSSFFQAFFSLLCHCGSQGLSTL